MEPARTGPKNAAELAFKYRDVVRRLPPKRYVDLLLRNFFTDVAWFYDVVDRQIFEEKLAAWDRVSYSTLSQDPLSLPPDVRLFPALLFQMLAQALLFQPVCSDNTLNDLKYAPQMSFSDLAAEHSDAGEAILDILGNRDATTVRVQAGLLRACFQKSTGCVIEAWHTLGCTIRDAQEIGLHCLGPPDDWTLAAPGTEPPSKRFREAEQRRKIWLVLHLWDGHMAVVLGRPMSTRLDPATFAASWHELDRATSTASAAPLQPTGHYPHAFDVILCGYDAAYRYLQDIHDLEYTSLRGESGAMVRNLHAAITSNIRHLPDWVRAENPNTEYDGLPTCFWLPAARETLKTEIYFVLLALHRPYIFSEPASRHEALEAALQILTSQSRLFSQTPPRQYMAFNLVFATFDAMVLIASIYILYPHENAHQLDASLRGIEWGLARLDAMRKLNRMAGAAYQTVHSLYGKLKHRLAAMPRAHDLISLNVSLDEGSLAAGLEHAQTCLAPARPGPSELELALNLDSVLPPQPLHDLVFQNIPSSDMRAASGLLSTQEPAAASGQPPPNSGHPDLLPDDFWRMMNGLDG
ncbi:hypothetical protein CDD83_7313 [Cordyceps sp. RAO-2017]|nr:hypothetical protein CDD83_7313 [Cordyceps sp. RAO-2017]